MESHQNINKAEAQSFFNSSGCKYSCGLVVPFNETALRLNHPTLCELLTYDLPHVVLWTP